MNRLRGKAEPVAPEADDAESARSEVRTVTIDIFTVALGSGVAVELDREQGRVTDLLNTASALTIRRGSEASESLAVEDVLLAIPPPQEPPDLQRRLHRIRLPIRIEIGPYRVEGHAHVPPGARPSGFLFRMNPRFIPLTEATVNRIDGSVPERSFPVVLVNFRRIDQITELSPDTPPAQSSRRDAPSQ